MEIMGWVKERVKGKGLDYYLIFFLVGLTAAVVASSGIFPLIESFPDSLTSLTWDSAYLWYIPFSGMLFVIFCLWLYYSPIVCQNWVRLKDAFSDNDYKDLYDRCQDWLRQFTITHPGRSWVFKCFYSLTWVLFIPCFPLLTACTFGEIHHTCVIICSIVLTLVVIILNFSSCYICIIFVYFLIRIYKLDQGKNLDYIKQFPSATKGFQMLNSFASIVYLYFLLDSLFSTLSYYAFWKIVNSRTNIFALITNDHRSLRFAFLYSTIFLVIFGLVTWVFIILVSRTYLHRLHNEWKLRSFQAFEEEYYNDESQREKTAAAMEKLTKDKIYMNRWEILISLVTLIANLVTVRSLFGS